MTIIRTVRCDIPECTEMAHDRNESEHIPGETLGWITVTRRGGWPGNGTKSQDYHFCGLSHLAQWCLERATQEVAAAKHDLTASEYVHERVTSAPERVNVILQRIHETGER